MHAERTLSFRRLANGKIAACVFPTPWIPDGSGMRRFGAQADAVGGERSISISARTGWLKVDTSVAAGVAEKGWNSASMVLPIDGAMKAK